MELMTSDENPAYAAAIRAVYGAPVPPRRRGRRGRKPKPRRQVPEGLTYATVPKTRQNNRVVKVEPRLIYGTRTALAAGLTNHIWALKEWLCYPGVQRKQDTT